MFIMHTHTHTTLSCMSAYHVHAVTIQGIRSQITRNWSYRGLWGIGPKYFAKALNPLRHWTVSPASVLWILWRFSFFHCLSLAHDQCLGARKGGGSVNKSSCYASRSWVQIPNIPSMQGKRGQVWPFTSQYHQHCGLGGYQPSCRFREWSGLKGKGYAWMIRTPGILFWPLHTWANTPVYTHSSIPHTCHTQTHTCN